MSVPTNLIPTPITGLPEYTGSSTLGYMPYVIDGQTFKVQFTNIAAVGAVPSTRVIASGTGLAGGGDLSADRVISIAAGGVGVNQLSLTGVTAGTYGSGSAVPVLTVDATGRVTSVTTTALSVTGFVPTSRTITAGSGLTGGGSLASDITLSASFSATTPLALGIASPGVAITLSRGDHVHPALDLSDTNQTQGALPLGRGGTGDALSPVAGAVVYSTGTKFALSALGSVGQVLVSSGTGAPVWTTLTGTGTVTSVNLTAGTGISVSGGPITTSGSINVVNTAPDQIVALTGAGTTVVTGTYPSFTITSTDSAAGTVTSVNASGGTTGLSFTGGPITTSGTLTLGGTLAIANGGTGAIDAPTALTNLGAYPASNPSGFTSNVGTVTSVSGTGTVSGLSLSGTVTSAGSLTLGGTLAVLPSNFASQTANTVLAAPNGVAGVPTFRAIVAADVPTLNQNTTGTASNVTGIVAVINGGTGQTTYTDGQLLIGNTTGNTLTKTTLTAGTNVTITNGSGAITINAADQFVGTVTSVGGTGTVSGLTLTGTVTTSGSLTLGGTLAVTPSNFASQTAKTFLAAPNASAGVPSFRAIIPADVPTLDQNTTGTASNVTGTVAVTNGGTGTATAFTAGSVVFAGASGVYSQDNANLFWDDTNDRLGIGTSSPGAKLDVVGNAYVRSGVMYSDTFSAYSGGNLSINAGTGFMAFATSATERMRIDSSGNVGIGITNPSAGRMVVRTASTTGKAFASDNTANTGFVVDFTPNLTSIGNDFNNPLALLTNNTERMRIDSSGNVGIGTTTIGVRLEVSGATRVTSGASGGYYGFNYSTLSVDSRSWSIYNDHTAYGDFNILTSSTQAGAPNTSRLYISAAGNVGIGTSSPASKLNVDGGSLAVGGAGILAAGSVTTGRLVSGGGATLNAIHTYFDDRAYELSAGSTSGYVSGVVVGARSYTGTGGDAVTLWTRSAERMRITSAGGLAVGTTTDPGAGNIGLAAGGRLQFSSTAFMTPEDNVAGARIVTPGAFNLATGGTAVRMTVDGSGNVGIGTSSPGQKLEVNGITKINTASAIWEILQLVNTQTASGAYMQMVGSPGGTVAIGADATAASTMVFRTAGVERARIDASGNVGIGTSSPGTYNLNVAGSLRAGNSIDFGNANTDPSIINVGVGATGNRFALIDFIGDTTYTDYGFRVGRYNNGANGTSEMQHRGTGALSLNAFDAGIIVLQTQNTERARITSSGLVGIGTSSPQVGLHVSFADQSTNRIRIQNTGAGGGNFDIVGGLAGVSNAGLSFFDVTNSATRMLIDSSGNVGIGCTPGYRLDVAAGDTTANVGYAMRLRSNATATAATLQFTNSAVSAQNGTITCTDAGVLTVQGDSASSEVRFRTNGSERARIDSSGNLLVGTTSTSNTPSQGITMMQNTNVGSIGIGHASGTADGNGYLQFAFNGASIGSVTQSGSGTAVLYNTTSDSRLKHDIVDAPDAASLIDAIQVRSFKWNADNSEQRYGFVAQELVEVAPEAVSQPADPDDMMGVDYSKLVPMLVKELQSLRARVAQLEGN